jgi:Xaa-Pro aminopeptidase
MVAQLTKTWDDKRLKQDRLALLQAEMRRQNVGGLYITDGVYQRYALNLQVPGGKVFVPVEGDAIALVRKRDLGYVELQHDRVHAPIGKENEQDRLDGGASTSKFAGGMVALLAELGLADERIGVDLLSPSGFAALAHAEIDIVDASPIIERAWTVKTPDEVEIFRTVGQEYVETVTAFRDAIRPGVTEIELATLVTKTWIEVGGEDIAQLNICAGENMNPWKRWPSERKLKAGEFVGIDLHGRGINGLRGDAGTTFLVGDNPTIEQRDLYRRAYDYLWANVDLMRAGRSIPEAMAMVPRVPDKYLAQLHNYNIAHGTGMGSSGYPHVNPRDEPVEDVIQLNQVLAVECYFGEEGSPVAVKLEEQIVVRDGAPEVLGGMPFDERLL